MKYYFFSILFLMAVTLSGCSSQNPPSVQGTSSISETSSVPETAAESSSFSETSQAESSQEESSQTEESDTIPLSALKFSPELLEFMQTINQEHEAIQKPDLDFETYKNTSDSNINWEFHQTVSSNTDGTLTAEQIENDLTTLISQLRTNYGLYNYFGGDTAFFAARDAILQECRETVGITPERFQSILLKYLSFVKDGHFSVNGKRTTPHTVAYFYQETAFIKTGQGYFNKETGQQVKNAEGWENLDELFKRSFSEQDGIVYYPIVLHEYQRDAKLPDLKLIYTDGSSVSLSASPFVPPVQEKDAPVLRLYEEEGIPILDYRIMNQNIEQNAQTFLAYAEALKDSSVMILDLRSNVGGNSYLSYKWLETYTGQKMSQNYFTILYNTYDLTSNLISDDMERETVYGLGTLVDISPDVFAENDNLLIILTSKVSTSAAESFIDMAHNVKNTLIIGENTGGCLIGNSNSNHTIYLKNSQLTFGAGSALHVFPEGYFEEFSGLKPDIWVQSGDAKKAALHFIHSMMEDSE